MRTGPTIRAAAALVLAAGCSDSSALTGRYCSTTPVTLPGVVGFENKYVAIEVAQYGPDIGGIVGFAADLCPDEFHDSSPCACAVIDRGVFNDGRVEFSFTFKETKCTQDGGAKIKASFKPATDQDGVDILTGGLDNIDDDAPPTEALTFKRLVSEKDVEKVDVFRRSCEKLLLGENGE